MHATLSLNGMLNVYPDLFSGLQVPATVDKDTVVNALLLDTIEFEVLIPNPKIIQQALSIYSVQMLPSWTRYALALGLEYKPLDTDNRNRKLQHQGEDNHSRNLQHQGTDLSTRIPNLTTTGQNNGQDETIRQVVGFDSAQFQDAEKNTTSLGTGNTVTSSGTDKTESSNSYTDTDKTNITNSYMVTETLTGRAGKSAQELVQEEITLAQENVISKIVNDIKEQFCLLVY